ncbi:Aerobic respiration control sensor protein ArcB [Variovorax sp. SRS16]|uniref:PAS domain-containing hybrid sensor histidine kinase/response regulator n=1 Tax=Variovorax sp. SRS16 TaxID=282217 RepID=UPI0013181C6D|nr:PAS domain-containing hybrid sensor histidine kinase/response regulator [Variovorax sp. SRS16]VTU27707.1 Aerobic respiration control sensor protein ArcB [Variovorax sp. SRS16]
MTEAPGDEAPQDAQSRLEAANQRQLELLRRVVELTRDRDRLTVKANRQAEEIGSLRRTLDATRRHLLVTDVVRLAQWEWDIASGSVFLSARWEEMIGAAAENNRWPLRDLLARVHPDDVPAVRQALDDALGGKADRYSVEHRVAAADGWIWIESIGMVTERDADGKALRLTGFNSDITARRRMHDEIEQARAQAEASSRAKSEFLANMSHEVRTPLNAVLGLTRLLHQSPLNDEQRQHLELIDNSAASLLALLNDILDLSKIEAGKLVFELIRFDIARWVREAVALHKLAAEKKGLQLEVDVSDDVPWKVAGDPGRLRQVISNLVSNAVKFTEAGRISVSARLAPQQSDLRRDQLRMLFVVRDTGVGVPADKQQQIFEAFTQEDASTTRRFGGTGLGLAICARLVSMMGGEIQLTSRPREGSTFRFTAVFEQAADEMSVLTEPAPLEAVATRGLNVLLAEDHAVNELLMRKLLAEMGCTFNVARNGEEAVRHWKTRQFDLVLMDVQMPVLSGFDATARIRAMEAAEPDRGRTPIVALTAHAMAGDREKCLAAGMDAYVSKPVSPALLSQAIHDAMRGATATGAPREFLLDTDFGPWPGSAPGASPAASGSDPSLPIDMQQLLQTMGGDWDAVRQLAATMRADMAFRRPAIQHAIAGGDSKAAQEQVHALKGALSTIGALQGAKMAKDVEASLRRDDWAGAQRSFGRMEPELERVDTALTQMIEGDEA